MRSLQVLDGAQAGLEKNLIRASWDEKGRKAAAGAGDGTVTVWDSESGKMLQKLPGHKGTVNDVRISPDGSLGKLQAFGLDTELQNFLTLIQFFLRVPTVQCY